MDTLRAIEELVDRAKREPTPEIDVCGRVLMRLETRTRPRILPLTVFAGVSAAAAVVLLFFAVSNWIYLTNPIMEFFTPLQEATLW